MRVKRSMFFPFKDSVEDFPYLIRKNLFEIHKDRKTQTAENYQYRYYDVECVMSVHYHWIAEITAVERGSKSNKAPNNIMMAKHTVISMAGFVFLLIKLMMPDDTSKIANNNNVAIKRCLFSNNIHR